MRRLLLIALLALGTAFAQAPETEEGGSWLPSPVGDLFRSGQVYCKASYDTGLPVEQATRSLCYAEVNILDAGGLRVGLATRLDFTPDFRTTPLLLLDYTDEHWFAGVETGYSLVSESGWYVGAYVGFPLSFLRP